MLLLLSRLEMTLKIAELCKGSTSDSDSLCSGSNPDSAARADLIASPLFLL